MTFRELGNNEDIMDQQTLDLSKVLIMTFQTFKGSERKRGYGKLIILFPILFRFAKKENYATDIL